MSSAHRQIHAPQRRGPCAQRIEEILPGYAAPALAEGRPARRRYRRRGPGAAPGGGHNMTTPDRHPPRGCYASLILAREVAYVGAGPDCDLPPDGGDLAGMPAR